MFSVENTHCSSAWEDEEKTRGVFFHVDMEKISEEKRNRGKPTEIRIFEVEKKEEVWTPGVFPRSDLLIARVNMRKRERRY